MPHGKSDSQEKVDDTLCFYLKSLKRNGEDFHAGSVTMFGLKHLVVKLWLLKAGRVMMA